MMVAPRPCHAFVRSNTDNYGASSRRHQTENNNNKGCCYYYQRMKRHGDHDSLLSSSDNGLIDDSPTRNPKDGSSSRRHFLQGTTVAATALSSWSWSSLPALATYQPAIRPLTYRVDSTIPPTLLSITPRQGQGILQALGRGSGTDKEAVIIDSINLNNMLNKAVFGAINSVSSLTGGNNQQSKASSSWTASFCCLAMPMQPQAKDVELAVQLMEPMIQASTTKNDRTGLGLYFCPYSTQPILNQYTAGELDPAQLQKALLDAGVSLETRQLYAPLFALASNSNNNNKKVDLIAMAPEVEDMVTVRSQGLQNVNAERRANYVVDAQGFIGLTQDPKFKLYTDRSLAKDYVSVDKNDSFGNFFSQRILAHEAGATAVAQYAVGSSSSSSSFVMVVAPMADLRFLGGINGRIPRICQFLQPECGVTNNAVTTILLNPTAVDTLSKIPKLRLEIGTGPETLDYQTKVADYLWFSESPKVNLIPRLMN